MAVILEITVDGSLSLAAARSKTISTMWQILDPFDVAEQKTN